MAPELDLRDEDFEIVSVSGLPHYLHVPSGWSRPVVSGGATDDDGDDADDPDDDDDGDDGDGDDAAAKERARVKKAGEKAGRRAAAKDLADQLGVTVAEAKKIIADHKKAAEDNKSEVDRAKAEAAEAKRERDDAKAQAAADRLAAKIVRRLVKAGIDPDAADRAARLVDVEDTDADVDDIDEAISELRDELPGLFAGRTSDDDSDGDGAKPRKQKAPGSTKAKPPKGGQATKDALKKGAEEARRRYPELVKESA